MSEHGVRIARTAADRAAAFDVRRAVFVDEQGVPESLELDEHDESEATVHVVADDGDRIVGAARLRPVGDGVGKVERVAVRADARGEGWGRRLMDAVESTARERGFDALTLHAQRHVESFYCDRGYRTVSGEFEEAGLPHVEMERRLDGGDSG